MYRSYSRRRRYPRMGGVTGRISDITKEVIDRNTELKYFDTASISTIDPISNYPYIPIRFNPAPGAENYEVVGDHCCLKSITVKYTAFVEVDLATATRYTPSEYCTGVLRVMVCRSKNLEPISDLTFGNYFDNVLGTARGRVLAFPKPEMVEVIKEDIQMVTAVNLYPDPPLVQPGGPQRVVDNNPLGAMPTGITGKAYHLINEGYNFPIEGQVDSNPLGKYFLCAVFSPISNVGTYVSNRIQVQVACRYSYTDL